MNAMHCFTVLRALFVRKSGEFFFSGVPLSPLDSLRFLVSEERIPRHIAKYAF